MAARNQQPNKPGNPDVELAIAALDGNPNPLDMAMEGIDPDPTSLDLEGSQQAMCSSPRRPRPAEDNCIICGQPVCEDCA